MTPPRPPVALPAVALPAVALLVGALLTGCATPATPRAPGATPTPTASAQPCRVSATLPETVAITGPTTAVRTTLTAAPAGCARYARYDVRKDGAFIALNRFRPGPAATWTLTAEDGPGTYQATFVRAYDRDFLAASGTRSDEMVVKYGSSLGTWRAERSKKKRTVRLSVRVQDFGAKGEGVGAGRTVVFQQRHGSTWTSIGSDTTDRVGEAAVRYRSERRGVYRAVLKPTATQWGAESDPHLD